MLPVFLLFLGLYGADAGTHSFKAFYTATTGITNYPEFTAAGVVDDVWIQSYNSFSKQVVPRTDWMKNSEGPDHWKQQTDIIVGTEQSFKSNIQLVMERFNHTGGIHTWQQMYGCSWDDATGDMDGFDEFGYDGEDFVSLDLKNLRYVSTLPEGVITQVKWNNDNALLQSKKQYRTQTCIEWLKKYLQYGKSSINREAPPQVSLLQTTSASPVMCHATGFYPGQVAIFWLKNGQEHHEDEHIGELLINDDGTFQRSSMLKVETDEWKQDQYTCVVEHKGKTIRMIVKEDNISSNNGSVPIAIIVAVVVAFVLLVVGGIVGFKIYQKKKGFKPVNTSDGGSNSSSNQTGA